MGLELVAGKPELLAKGYLSLYTEITGESVWLFKWECYFVPPLDS